MPVTLEVEGPVPVLPVAGVLPVPEVTGVDTPGAEGGRPAPAPAWAPMDCSLPFTSLKGKQSCVGAQTGDLAIGPSFCGFLMCLILSSRHHIASKATLTLAVPAGQLP